MSFNSEILPTNYEVIERVNENDINSVESFIETISNVKENQSLKIYTSVKKEGYVINFTKKENQTNLEALGLNVKEKAKSNIRLGIELEGGQD